ncbi:hypothetical protein N9B94_04990 [Verrucomicrobia bacterium]|nr:hypothetical protein [Verrucomicrobiota bacterium]
MVIPCDASTLTWKELDYNIADDNRIGDHMWWVSDVRKFQRHYPNWAYRKDLKAILTEIINATAEREGITL